MKPFRRTLGDLVRLSRPHFLLGGLFAFALGAATAPSLLAGRYWLAQLMVSSAQLAAHFLNEFADRFADEGITNRTAFSGGSGVLVSGHLDPAIALRAGQVASVVAVGAAAAVWQFSPVAAVLGVIALVVSWGYSMPPVRLLGTGWGELATTIIVVGAVPLIGAFSQGSVGSEALYFSIAILLPVHFAMMLGFEIPDIASDRAAGKQVLAVRLGRSHTDTLLVACWLVSAVELLIAVFFGALGPEALWGLGGAIPAWLAGRSLRRNRFAFGTLAAVVTLVVVLTALVFGVRQ